MATDLYLLEKARHLLLNVILGVLQPNSSSWAGTGISMVGGGWGQVHLKRASSTIH